MVNELINLPLEQSLLVLVVLLPVYCVKTGNSKGKNSSDKIHPRGGSIITVLNILTSLLGNLEAGVLSEEVEQIKFSFE